ncbi:hypothetical protein SAMN04487901_11982 [Prevotella communis]|uniref:Uncharacterized protein n=1 Tax=Prevotella communis TaxID=2913614 RepID=A0A1G8AJB8_9BACT|nr:hypothetical protein SAMN04487901_11982 [Prevotella communis]
MNIHLRKFSKVTKDTYNATKVHFIFQATKAFSLIILDPGNLPQP